MFDTMCERDLSYAYCGICGKVCLLRQLILVVVINDR